MSKTTGERQQQQAKSETMESGSNNPGVFRVNARSQVRPKQYKRKYTRASLNSELSYVGGDDSISEELTIVPEHKRLNQSVIQHGDQTRSVQDQIDIQDDTRFSTSEEDTDSSTNDGGQGQTTEPLVAETAITDGEQTQSLDIDSKSDELHDDHETSCTSNDDNFECGFIDLIKHQEIISIDDILKDLENKNHIDDREEENVTEEVNEDEPSQFYAELTEDAPVQPGHALTLKMSILLIWVFAIKHSLTSPQLTDLLTLINLHLFTSNPAFQSLHRFKKFFSMTKLDAKKHLFCSSCHSLVNVTQSICSNEMCHKKINEKDYFLELGIKAQLQNFFKRKDFLDGLKYRFDRSKKKINNIEDIYDSNQYQKLYNNNGPLSEENNISFTLNTDGVPIFKSSKTSMWPIFLMINELPYNMRKNREYMLLAGLWCGPTKPTMNLFLNPLLESLKELEAGITVTKNNLEVLVKGFLLSLSCDIPARSVVLNMNQHNGECCCVKCLQTGINHRTEGGGNIRTFPYNITHPDGPERTHKTNIQSAEEAMHGSSTVNGIKGPSVIMFCPQFDSAKGIAIDYMHLVCLGVIRLLLKLWFNVSHGLKVFSIYRYLDIVDSRLESIKPPHYISRQPRTIKEHSKYWKASELRSWMFYYSIPCISDLMHPKYLYHYCALVEGVYLLCQSSISENDILKSEQLLRYFVFMLPSLYDERFFTINVHSLLHLPSTVKELGPLWSHSCFSFEGANGELLKLFHGTQYIDLQITNAVHVFQSLPILTETVTVNSVAYKFMKSLTKSSDLDRRQFSFCGKPYNKPLSENTRVSIVKFLNGVINKLEFYYRASIRGVLYHSQDYTRVLRRNSYSVRYVQNKTLHYGYILWFAKHEHDQSNEIIKCACIEKLIPTKDFNMFDRNIENISPDTHVRNNFMNINLPNLCFLQQTGEKCIVSLHDILDLCICIAYDGIVVLCEEPNHSENNL